MIQKRAKNKYHSGGLWSNSCCSHQYKGEEWVDAIKRCVFDELELSLPFTKCYTYDVNQPHSSQSNLSDESALLVGSFKYFADLGGVNEHEIDHVVICLINKELIQKIRPDPDEVEEVCWMSFPEIEDELYNNKVRFTAWFEKAFQLVKKYRF